MAEAASDAKRPKTRQQSRSVSQVGCGSDAEGGTPSTKPRDMGNPIVSRSPTGGGRPQSNNAIPFEATHTQNFST